MTDADKRSLDQIVSEAQTLPPGEQLRFIRDACASDDAKYVSALEQMHSRQRWLEDAPEEVANDAGPPAPDPTGHRVGPYRIVRSLGQGGMGEVFLAERADDQFRKQVAIKVVRRGLLSRHVQGRLKQERQILASLEHPNIARLFDGGTTSDGTPYIVMEYIDGEPIDIYCDRRALTIEQRLRLFMVVCSAVHRAHQNLIVHRDLKPSNILVTTDGVPKLLDFGIAKLLDDREMMHTLAVTQADVRVMTPDHASPEQIRGDLISTASDIYVLGVLLYELLSGCKPFILRGTRLAELERTICEESAPSLSSAAETQSSEQIAAQRSVTLPRLRRELQGDLDNIVKMAMRKEPERRYSSVEQFAADIQRFLDDMPVLARPDSWSYRATRFVQRHTVVVGLSVAFVVTLLAFSITVYLQAERIGVERDVAQAERVRAEGERERAEAVSSFLLDSFRVADPYSQGGGAEVTARQILDNGAERITGELRNQPDLQANVLDTIGGAYLGLGLHEQAQPLIEQGLDVRRELYGERSVPVAQSLYSLTRVYENKGDLDTAERLARDSLAINREIKGEASLEAATSLCRLGVILREKDQLSAAAALLEDCRKIRGAILGRYHELLTIPLDNLARIAAARNDFPRAESLLNEALEIDRRTRGETHPQYIRHLLRLAQVTYDKGDAKAAEPLYKRSVDLFGSALGEDHPEAIDALSAFGLFLTETGRLDEAQPIMVRVLELNRARRGLDHPYVGNDLENLGRLAFRRNDFPAAARYFNDALRIYRAKLRPGHGFIATTSAMLGRTLLAQNKLAEAQTILTSAADAWRLGYGDKSPGYAMARASLARVWVLQGAHAKAEPVLLESYPILAGSSRTPDIESSRLVRQWIEDLYKRTGRPEAAQEYFTRLAATP
jgi:eukaryotic-like serine/threonine-protein kinase